jgi:fumarate reductase flavoprotein subunit
MMMEGIAFENWKVGGYYAAIFSNDVLEKIRDHGAEFTSAPMFLGQGQPPAADVPIPELDDILAFHVGRGNVVKAETLEELAGELKVPPENLTATVTQYNTFVAKTATDSEYNKSNYSFFGPPADYYTDGVTEDPTAAKGYTAILGAGYYYGTCGGLDIDGDMQVLNNTNHEKIPGLYAVGQDSMGVLFNKKKAYVGYGAAAQGWAITSGRLAGANAAAYAAATN